LASVEAVPANQTVEMFDGKGRTLKVRRPEWWPKTDPKGNPTTVT
jgi:hypothetical protein